MTKDEYDRRLRAVIYTCKVNERYHHTLAWWWGCADRCIRILVGILAIAGAIFAVPKLDYPWLGFYVAVLSAVAAAVLNIVPVGDWEKKHWDMFQRWSDIQRNAAAEEFKTCELEGPPEAHHLERLQELLQEMESLHGMETAPWNRLLNRCQEVENEREWGKGVRTHEQVETERARRLAAYRTAANPSADAGVSGADRG